MDELYFCDYNLLSFYTTCAFWIQNVWYLYFIKWKHWYTIRIQIVYNLYTVCIQNYFILLYTLCIQMVYKWYTNCIQNVYNMYTHVYKVYTNCIQNVYKMYTKCMQNVYKMYAKCIQFLGTWARYSRYIWLQIKLFYCLKADITPKECFMF